MQSPPLQHTLLTLSGKLPRFPWPLSTSWPQTAFCGFLHTHQHWKFSGQMTEPSWELPRAAVGSGQRWTAAARFASAHCSWTHTAPNPANKTWPQKVKMDTLHQPTTLWPAQLFLQTWPPQGGQKKISKISPCLLSSNISNFLRNMLYVTIYHFKISVVMLLCLRLTSFKIFQKGLFQNS